MSSDDWTIGGSKREWIAHRRMALGLTIEVRFDPGVYKTADDNGVQDVLRACLRDFKARFPGDHGPPPKPEPIKP